jgi:hypothetical protein
MPYNLIHRKGVTKMAVIIERDGDIVKFSSTVFNAKFGMEFLKLPSAKYNWGKYEIASEHEALAIDLCKRVLKHDGTAKVPPARDEHGCLSLTKGTAKQKAWAQEIRVKGLMKYTNEATLQKIRDCRDAEAIIKARNTLSNLP